MKNDQRPTPSEAGHHGEMSFTSEQISDDLRAGDDLRPPVDPAVAKIFARGLEGHLAYMRECSMIVFAANLRRCGSKLEQKMFAALCFIADGYMGNPPVFRVRFGDADTKSVCLEPQHQVGPYTVDFALHAASPVDSQPIKVAVECDGHYWHDRTPEQAARDKKRDRFLAAQGYTVLRFTEAEINSDAGACANQVEAVIAAAQEAAIEHETKRISGEVQ